MKNKKITYAFIDSQNLNLGLSKDVKIGRKLLHKGWKLDFQQFYIYLKDVLRVTKVYLFIGYVYNNQGLYTYLQECGYILVFRPTLETKNGIKGNVDTELVLHTMIQFENYDKAIIISGDGDFHCLIEYLIEKDKLKSIVIPNKLKYSSLLREFNNYFIFVNKLKSRLEKKPSIILDT